MRLGPAVLSSLAVISATTLAAATPAAAAGEEYVALGDSYSSGLGTRTYVDDGTECRRSPAAFASLIASANGWNLNLRACSGATVPDVTASQLGALSASTSYVSISVGGNDAGFADVLTECALPGWASDCDGAVDGAQSYIAGTLPGALTSLYSSIRSGAPAATVVVVGYPHVFMGEDCNAATFFSPEEEARLNATADQLNGVLASAASAAGFGFADPTSAFTGHAVCDDPEWINGLSDPIDESYHPKHRRPRERLRPARRRRPHRLRVPRHSGGTTVRGRLGARDRPRAAPLRRPRRVDRARDLPRSSPGPPLTVADVGAG